MKYISYSLQYIFPISVQNVSTYLHSPYKLHKICRLHTKKKNLNAQNNYKTTKLVVDNHGCESYIDYYFFLHLFLDKAYVQIVPTSAI